MKVPNRFVLRQPACLQFPLNPDRRPYSRAFLFLQARSEPDFHEWSLFHSPYSARRMRLLKVVRNIALLRRILPICESDSLYLFS